MRVSGEFSWTELQSKQVVTYIFPELQFFSSNEGRENADLLYGVMWSCVVEMYCKL